MKKPFKTGFLSFVVLLFALFFSRSARNVKTVVAADSANQIFLSYISTPCDNHFLFQPVSDPRVEEDTLSQINTQRATNGGLAPLAMNGTLVQAARFHSYDMANNGITTHNGSAGETAWDRYSWLCEFFGWKGEIIGWGFGGDAAQMMDWWMNSKDHHDTILKPEFTVAGVGFVAKPDSDWGTYWTIDFGSLLTPASLPALASRPPTCTTTTETSSQGGMSVTICQ